MKIVKNNDDKTEREKKQAGKHTGQETQTNQTLL